MLTKITRNPGTVNSSNNLNMQKHKEPVDKNKNFFRITPEDFKPLIKRIPREIEVLEKLDSPLINEPDINDIPETRSSK